MNQARILALAAAAGLVVCTGAALADEFFTTQGGGGSNGAVVQRRQGTSGTIAVPVDENNPLPVTGAGGAATAGSVGSAGTNGTTAQSVQGITGGVQIATLPGGRTIVPLDVSTVTTGGTAVTALTAGHRTAGGWLYNPSTATVNLCINEIGTASGTTSQGNLTCVPPDRAYNLVASGNAVSVISSDSAHPFSGYGLQ